MFDRGFTGHEHMTAFGLINMNGRCYDPLTSSFLSVDAYVQDPTSAQAFNRYAYCGYNPLRYTDPTGWSPDGYGRQPQPQSYDPTARYHSDDPNDVLWGRSVHPWENSSSGFVNGTAVTRTGYTEGNNGLKGSNYTVDRKGDVKKHGANDRIVDVLYTFECWDSGKKDVYIEIPIGTLKRKNTVLVEGIDELSYTIDMYNLNDDNLSTDLFEFLAANTDVEWSQTFVGQTNSGKSILSTSHDRRTEVGQGYLLRNGWTIRAHNHSHPYNIIPSLSDRKWASVVHNKFPNASLNIYYKGVYYEYNQEGLIYIDVKQNLYDAEIIFDTNKYKYK